MARDRQVGTWLATGATGATACDTRCGRAAAGATGAAGAPTALRTVATVDLPSCHRFRQLLEPAAPLLHLLTHRLVHGTEREDDAIAIDVDLLRLRDVQ